MWIAKKFFSWPINWPKQDFGWLRKTKLIELSDLDVTEDPVRPELDLEFRTSYGRKMYGLQVDGQMAGVICVAFTSDIPHSVRGAENNGEGS